MMITAAIVPFVRANRLCAMTADATRRRRLALHAWKLAAGNVRVTVLGHVERRCSHEQRKEARTRKGKRHVVEEEATHASPAPVSLLVNFGAEGLTTPGIFWAANVSRLL